MKIKHLIALGLIIPMALVGCGKSDDTDKDHKTNNQKTEQQKSNLQSKADIIKANPKGLKTKSFVLKHKNISPELRQINDLLNEQIGPNKKIDENKFSPKALKIYYETPEEIAMNLKYDVVPDNIISKSSKLYLKKTDVDGNFTAKKTKPFKFPDLNSEMALKIKKEIQDKKKKIENKDSDDIKMKKLNDMASIMFETLEPNKTDSAEISDENLLLFNTMMKDTDFTGFTGKLDPIYLFDTLIPVGNQTFQLVTKGTGEITDLHDEFKTRYIGKKPISEKYDPTQIDTKIKETIDKIAKEGTLEELANKCTGPDRKSVVHMMNYLVYKIEFELKQPIEVLDDNTKKYIGQMLLEKAKNLNIENLTSAFDGGYVVARLDTSLSDESCFVYDPFHMNFDIYAADKNNIADKVKINDLGYLNFDNSIKPVTH